MPIEPYFRGMKWWGWATRTSRSRTRTSPISGVPAAPPRDRRRPGVVTKGRIRGPAHPRARRAARAPHRLGSRRRRRARLHRSLRPPGPRPGQELAPPRAAPARRDRAAPGRRRPLRRRGRGGGGPAGGDRRRRRRHPFGRRREHLGQPRTAGGRHPARRRSTCSGCLSAARSSDICSPPGLAASRPCTTSPPARRPPTVTRVSEANETRFSFATKKSQRKLAGRIVARHGGLCIGSGPLYDQKKFDTPLHPRLPPGSRRAGRRIRDRRAVEPAAPRLRQCDGRRADGLPVAP
jgi:hypothetical protein